MPPADRMLAGWLFATQEQNKQYRMGDANQDDENKQLKELVAELTLDSRMLKHITEGNW